MKITLWSCDTKRLTITLFILPLQKTEIWLFMVNWLEDWERSPSQLMSTAYLSKDFITDSIGSLRVGFYHETTLTADVKIWHSVSSWCRILIKNDWTVLCSSQKDAFNYSLCHLEVLLFSKNPCHKLPVSKPSSSPKKWVCNEVKIQFLNSVCLQIFDYNIQGMWLCRLFSCWRQRAPENYTHHNAKLLWLHKLLIFTL